MKLFGFQNAKTSKGEKLGWLTAIQYLQPVKNNAEGVNLCPHASAGCAAACLRTAGRLKFDSAQDAATRKTNLLLQDPDTYFALARREIEAARKRAKRAGLKLAVRLNGTSDVRWENLSGGHPGLTLPERFPGVQFYDYTKYPLVARSRTRNYHLTFSFSERPDAWERSKEWLDAGRNVAVVFSGALPHAWRGYEVIDGDAHDLRFLDPPGTIVGLKAKGAAKKDTSGFVQIGGLA